MANLLRSYLFWTYERGSLHYDVIVTAHPPLSLRLAPLHRLQGPPCRDRRPPLQRGPRQRGRHRNGDAARFIYQMRADDMGNPTSDAERQRAILRLIEPISGDVTLERYEPVKDSSGRTVAYNAWVLR